jgi:LysM repeat protein
MSTMTTTPTATVASISLAAAEPPTIHLTRRGRLLITSLVLLVLAGLFLFSAGRSEAGDPSSVATTTRVVVQPGQTLWQVAAAAMPGTDTREAITYIRELNALTTSVVRPGQSLLVPASA